MSEDEVLTSLRTMQANPLLLTESVYRGNSEVWPNHRMSFIDYHLAYLKVHPTLDPKHYLANLRLVLRKTV